MGDVLKFPGGEKITPEEQTKLAKEQRNLLESEFSETILAYFSERSYDYKQHRLDVSKIAADIFVGNLLKHASNKDSLEIVTLPVTIYFIPDLSNIYNLKPEKYTIKYAVDKTTGIRYFGSLTKNL